MNTCTRNQRHLQEFQIQQQYYGSTACRYDQMHVSGDDEHDFALSFLVGLATFLRAESILDIGSGTGRAIRRIKRDLPKLRAIGIEPSDSLRNVGVNKFGLGKEELISGDALDLDFPSNSFDIVCEFGVLHHIKTPDVAVNEMLRVARKAIFISDSNNFGQGNLPSRMIKQFLNSLKMWRVVDYIKTGGKGYILSDGDGLSYSYSVFNNYGMIEKNCRTVHVMNTMGKSINHYRDAGHVVVIGVL